MLIPQVHQDIGRWLLPLWFLHALMALLAILLVAGGQLEIVPTGGIDREVQAGRLIVEPGGFLQGHYQMPLPTWAEPRG